MIDLLTPSQDKTIAWLDIRCPFCRKLYLKMKGNVVAVQLECRCRCKTSFLVTNGKVGPLPTL